MVVVITLTKFETTSITSLIFGSVLELYLITEQKEDKLIIILVIMKYQFKSLIKVNTCTIKKPL